MEFINQHRHRLEKFSYNARILFSGSFSEIPIVYFFTKPTDLDFMMYIATVCAVPKNTQLPSRFMGEILTIDPKGLPPGFVTLKTWKNECFKHLQTYDYDNPNGPALQTPVGWSALTFDMVFSVQCPYWPQEAQEWQTRHRPNGWPSKDLTDQIVSEGCFLVGKSHPNCKDDDDTQWRYSFSKAEMRLISSWTDSQKYVYHVLRLIKSEFVKEGDDKKKSGLCTYHLKTKMFWACEEKPAAFWEDGNILTCVCELLTEIEQHLIKRNFPNYFLRDCNILEGTFIENDFSEVKLNTEFGRSFLKTQLPPKVCNECRVSVSLPVKMAPFIHTFVERFGIPFQAHRPKLDKVQELINEEMDDLMNGIYNMQMAQTLGDSFYAVAEQHFRNCIGTEETLSKRTMPVLNWRLCWTKIYTRDLDEVKCIKLTHRASLNAMTAVYESLANAELSTLEEGQNQWDMSVMISCTKDYCPYAGKSWYLPWKKDEHGKFYEKWMNPTHLLSASYLSNLYFITENYSACFETVRKQHSLALNAFNSELFPMIFCPDLASLFDKNLQEVLGFLWLFIHLLGGKRIFEFLACPHLFMLYIRIQCSIRLGDEDLEVFKDVFNRHHGNCKYRFYLYSYHYVLFDTAWRNSERRRKIE